MNQTKMLQPKAKPGNLTRNLRKLCSILIFMVLASAGVYAQSPQWVLPKPAYVTASSPTETPSVLNYFLSASEQDDPFYINRLSPEYIKQGTLQPLIFSNIYGSYIYSFDNGSPWPINHDSYDNPYFIIGKENGSNDVKIWSTHQKVSGYNPAFTEYGGSTQSLFTGQYEIYQNEDPEFTIIPRIGYKYEYLAFTYIRTNASNGVNGSLVYFLINASTRTFIGPNDPSHNGVSIQPLMDTWGARGAIAIQKPLVVGDIKQNLYLSVEGKGIYKFNIEHQNSAELLNTTGLTFPNLYPNNLICGINTGPNNNYPAVPGSTFITSELEISPDGTLLAWGDDNSDSSTGGGAPTATVYTVSLNTNPRVVTSIPISGNLHAQTVNGIEFNPHYNPANNVNTQLYVTAGDYQLGSGDDGLFKISGTGNVNSVPGRFGGSSRPCAQSQLEIDYNKALAMVYADENTHQFRTYLPESATQTGSWNNAYRYKDVPNNNYHQTSRLPRQVDKWDYKFGGTIHGPKQPKVAEGGCTDGAVQTNVTYAAPTITSIYSWDRTYDWKLLDLDNRDANGNPTLVSPGGTGSASTFSYNFSTTPFRSYQLVLRVIITEYGPNFSTVATLYETKMQIRTANGCQPPLDSRMAPNNPEGNGNEEKIIETVLFPNPVTNGNLYVKLPNGYNDAIVEITDLQGRLVRKGNMNNGSAFDVQNLSAGIYLVNVITPDFSKKEKLVISK